MPARLVLLATSPRVAPGLLSARAWSTLAAADVVLVGDGEHPLLPVLGDAGLSPRLVEAPDGADVAAVQAQALVAELRGDVDTTGPAASTRTVVWLVADHGDAGLAEAIDAALPSGHDAVVEAMSGSWDLPGARLLDLVAVMDRLRSPGGCPWDAQQTHDSLVEYLVEETYETVEAIETRDDDALREELGDLLLQVMFHARIAEEHDVPWSVDDVATGIVDKLVSRHPHVFGADAADRTTTAEQVEATWQSLKNAEKGRESVTDGVPVALPALVLATKLLKRSAAVGVAPVPPEVAVVAASAAEAVRSDPDVQPAYGDLLLALVARARADGVDPDVALRAAARRYRSAVRSAEGLAQP